MKKGAGAGSISQRYRSGDPDPDPHQNVTDPQHWFSGNNKKFFHTIVPLSESFIHNSMAEQLCCGSIFIESRPEPCANYGFTTLPAWNGTVRYGTVVPSMKVAR
jgi:hypothetical protein